jgi:hypothetical protein
MRTNILGLERGIDAQIPKPALEQRLKVIDRRRAEIEAKLGQGIVNGRVFPMECPLLALADNPTAPAFVGFWTIADKGGVRPGTVCPLMTQSGH